MFSALNKKLFRDLVHLRGQLFAVALVVACGIASFVAMRSTYDSMLASEQDYYAAYRFADVFASLKRAPRAVAREIGKIPGVALVQTRATGEAVVDLPGLTEPAQCRIVSVPATGAPALNELYLLRGRYILPENSDEIVVSGAFAGANRLNPGDSLIVILNGRKRNLKIVAVALSPEYVYEIRPGDIFPDNRRFGVIWMNEREAAAAFDMAGAFNDAALALTPGADAEQVVADLDHLLENYGGTGAYERSEQISARFVSNEISQQKIFGTALPAIFLSVTAFLLHLVLSRLVGTEREQIAVLKAFGYNSRAVGWHYLQLALTAVAVGVVLGAAGGAWLGSKMTGLYTEFFHFPVLRYELNISVVVISFLISFAAAAFGALAAVKKAVELPPAEAMRPESPPDFRAGFLKRNDLEKYFSAEVRMVFRNLSRKYTKALISIFGIALSVALLIVGFYFFDAVERIIEVQFYHAQTEDAGITFTKPLAGAVRYEIARLPGVKSAEMFRAVPARLRFGHRSRRVAVLGLEREPILRKIVDENFETKHLPPEGLVLSAHLAGILGVAAGDSVIVEVKEGERPVREIKIAATIDELIGHNAYMDIDALHRLMREQDAVSGAFLSVDDEDSEKLYSRLKNLPNVSVVSLPKTALESFNETFARNIGTSTFILIVFAAVITFGVIYNGARIALAERGREFASLRVLGFTQAEISVMLLGEQAVLTLAAIPTGFVFGILLSGVMNAAVDVDLMRLPLVFSAKTFIYSFFIVVLTAVLSGLLVAWRLRNLDLIEVLKTRE